jgi:hypothetical protein
MLHAAQYNVAATTSTMGIVVSRKSLFSIGRDAIRWHYDTQLTGQALTNQISHASIHNIALQHCASD